MKREQAVKALAEQLASTVSQGKDGTPWIEGELSGVHFRLRVAKEGEGGFRLWVGSVPSELRMSFREASVADRLHSLIFGWRRRSGNARFNAEVFVVSSLPSASVRLVLGSREVCEAMVPLIEQGLNVSFAVGQATAEPARPDLELHEELVRDAVVRLDEAARAASQVTDKIPLKIESKFAQNLEGYLVSVYVVSGFIPLAWMPLDLGPRLVALLAFVACMAGLPLFWNFLGRNTGSEGLSWKEDGWMWLFMEAARSMAPALWLTFGLNALAGHEPSTEHRTTVVDVSLINTVTVKSWRPDETTISRYIGKGARKFSPNQPVKLSTRVGFLGWDYVSREIDPIPPEPAAP